MQPPARASFRQSAALREARANDANMTIRAIVVSVVCLPNRQRGAGTRRVHQVEHTRTLAGILDTNESADFQGKRGRECARVYARAAQEMVRSDSQSTPRSEVVDGSGRGARPLRTPKTQSWTAAISLIDARRCVFCEQTPVRGYDSRRGDRRSGRAGCFVRAA